MRRHARSILILALCLPCAAALAYGQQSRSRVTDDILSIANGADNEGRRLAITRALDAAGVVYKLEEFAPSPTRKGTNIAVTVGRGPKVIVMGAHYDRVASGKGALDNGASCAVLLQLIQSFKSNPLDGYALHFVFFDLEEAGLLGSRAYFSGIEAPPAFAINMDVFGYGETIFATTAHPSGALAEALRTAGKELKFPVVLTAPAEYPSSDHRTMIAAGVETLGVSLLDAIDVARLTRSVPPEDRTPPRVLTIIHTANDTPDVIRATEVERAIPLIERLLRLVADSTTSRSPSEK